MTLYLDLILIVNFVVNYTFFYLLMYIFHEYINYKKLILSSIISCIFLLSFFFNYIIYNFIKIFGCLLLVLFTFGINKLIARTSFLYLIEFSFTGIIDSYKIRGMYLIGALFIIISLLIIQNLQKQSIFSNNFKYNVCIKTNKQKKYLAFLDTGNIATLDNIPIVFLKQEYYDSSYKIYGKTTITGINDTFKYECYRVNDFYLEINNRKIKKDVLIAFAPLAKDIECLLNYHLFC